MDMAPSRISLPRVVLVEDDDSLALLLLYNLEAIRFSVDRMSRGDVALIALIARPPTLVVLDWMLPGLAGIELLRQLRRNAQTRHVPVLMLTGCASSEDRRRALACGANAFVAKPFAMGELLAKINRLYADTMADRHPGASEAAQ